MKKIWDTILNDEILEGFPGMTHTFLGDCDVVVHHFEIGQKPWIKIYQSWNDTEVQVICLNDDDNQLKGLYKLLKNIYEK